MKDSSKNNYHNRINRVIDYIGDHLDEELSLEKLAQISYFSIFHFHRIFRALVGESIGSYQLRLRLEKSVYMLRFNPSKSITDIAFSLGFNSSPAFNRAFKNLFNITPSEERKSIPYNKKQFSLQKYTKSPFIKVWEVKYLPSILVYFYRYVGSYSKNAVREEWCNHIKKASEQGIVNEKTRYYGIVHDDPDITDDDKCRYDCCISIDKMSLSDTKEINGGKFAIFHFEGNPVEDTFNAYQWIYGKWFPENNYEPDDRLGYNDYYDFQKGTEFTEKSVVRYNICMPIKDI